MEVPVKKRIRVDLAFPATYDTTQIMTQLKALMKDAENVNEGKSNVEISSIELEECRHDEGGSCTILERHEKALSK
jgi:hypothetical protein